MKTIELGRLHIASIYCSDGNIQSIGSRVYGGRVSEGEYIASAGFEDNRLRYLQLSLFRRYDGVIPETIEWTKTGSIGVTSGAVILIDRKAIDISDISSVSNFIIQTINSNYENKNTDADLASLLWGPLTAEGNIEIIWKEDIGIVATGVPDGRYDVFYGAYDNKFSGHRILFR